VLHLMVSYARGGFVSGNAYVPGPGRRKHFSNSMRLRIPKPPGVTIRAGSVAGREHARGRRPAQGHDCGAVGLHDGGAVGGAPAAPRQRSPEKPDPELRKAALRSSRLEHAQAMLAKAETRAKRAETILKKWKRRVGALSR